MEKNNFSVCAYCSSTEPADSSLTEAARELGRLMGERKIHLITGGGVAGMMRHLTDAVTDNGGTALGIIPRFMIERQWCNMEIEHLPVETMHERKTIMAERSDAFVALPGGIGTFEELLEIITWKQLGLHSKPVVILNTNGFFDPLLKMFERASRDGFIRWQNMSLWKVAGTPHKAIEYLLAPDQTVYVDKVL